MQDSRTKKKTSSIQFIYGIPCPGGDLHLVHVILDLLSLQYCKTVYNIYNIEDTRTVPS